MFVIPDMSPAASIRARNPGPSVTIVVGAASSNWPRRNVPLRKTFNGTAMAPSAQQPNSSSIISMRLGQIIATRSPGRTPSRSSPPATPRAVSASCSRVTAWPSHVTNGASASISAESNRSLVNMRNPLLVSGDNSRDRLP